MSNEFYLAYNAMMSHYDYKRPFDAADFRGYFTWTEALTKRLDERLYHACHEDELVSSLDGQQLELRSEWSLNLPRHGLWTVPGVWCGLNFFQNGNFYGPFLFTFPLGALNGRTFMVFRREATDRHRHFFVQYEAGIPIFEFEGEVWRRVNSAHYFTKDRSDNSLSLKKGAIYDIVLTAKLVLTMASVRGVSHPSCIPKKCRGSLSKKNCEAVCRLGKKALKKMMRSDPSYAGILRTFPNIAGERMEIPELED